MSSKPDPALAGLDALVAEVGFPVRDETLERAWALAVEAPASGRFQEAARRTFERSGPAAGEVMIIVTLRAKPGREPRLEEEAREFVQATNQLVGSLGSMLYRSTGDPLTFTLVERFVDREVIARHMASDYFQRFQIAQQPLLAAPVDAVILERIGE